MDAKKEKVPSGPGDKENLSVRPSSSVQVRPSRKPCPLRPLTAVLGQCQFQQMGS